MTDLEFVQLSDTGRTREHNEDFLGYMQCNQPLQRKLNRTAGFSLWPTVSADRTLGKSHRTGPWRVWLPTSENPPVESHI